MQPNVYMMNGIIYDINKTASKNKFGRSLISDKRQIRTNRLLPKGSDYFDLVEMRGVEPLSE